MPLAGKGMLLTSMDIAPSDEAEFNRWYDREHLLERVAIDGFLEARRYVAHQGSPKYLCLYSTATFDVLDSPAYRAALMNPTEWSKTNLARFENMIRTVARITISRGQGRGAALGIVRLRPAAGSHDRLRHRDPSDRERSGAVKTAYRRSAGIGPRRRRLVHPDRCHRCERASRGDGRALHGIGNARRRNKDIVGELSADVGSRTIGRSIVLNQCMEPARGHMLQCHMHRAALKLGGQTYSEWRLSKNGFSVYRQ
jgi:hypothetical protein